jgi:hypothetical protein
MPVEYRKYDATTATETTIEPATPQSNTSKGGDSLDLDYDSDLSFSSIGLSVLALEKRKTRSQTAKREMPAKKKTPKNSSVGIPSAVEQGQERKSKLSKQ